MNIGIFSKIGSKGGSEHRCVELANGISEFTQHRAFLLCEEHLNPIFRHAYPLHKNVDVVENIFKPQALNHGMLYEMDRLLIVNSDSYSFTKRAYWQGQTEHHQQTIDLLRLPPLTFLFNFVITPAHYLASIAELGVEVKIICSNAEFMKEISGQTKNRFSEIQTLPRFTLPSPIDKNSISIDKYPDKLIRIGRHSRAFNYKLNSEIVSLIEAINRNHSDEIQWDFMGVPRDHPLTKCNAPNLIIRNEYSMPVREYLKQIDIFLFFIDWNRHEPWSRSVAEAMLSGCPILATNKGGNKEQIIPGNNGFLCNDISDFEKSLIKLINSKALRNEMARNSILYGQQFTTDKIIQQLMDILE